MTRIAALMLTAAAGCTTAVGDDLRIGVAAGAALTGGSTQRRIGDPKTPTLDTEASPGGFTELVLDDTLRVRIVATRERHELANEPGSAELEQVASLLLFSTDIPLSDTLRLVPMGGLGFGYAAIDFSQDAIHVDEAGATALVSFGLELEIGRHAMLGAMGWGGLLGDPGDTEGEFATGLIYAGVRF